MVPRREDLPLRADVNVSDGERTRLRLVEDPSVATRTLQSSLLFVLPSLFQLTSLSSLMFGAEI